MTSVPHRRIICICLLLILLFLTGCGTSKAYPPSEESVRSAAEQLGWTLQSDLTASRQAGQITYSLSKDDRHRLTVNCASVSGKRMLSAISTVTMLPEKPEFSWEDWKDVISLVEAMYGSFSKGELYKALSGPWDKRRRSIFQEKAPGSKGIRRSGGKFFSCSFSSLSLHSSSLPLRGRCRPQAADEGGSLAQRELSAKG